MILFWVIQVCRSNDVFEWFRCDACRTTFYQLKSVASTFPRLDKMKVSDFMDKIENFCTEKTFNKHDYGVKQFEGKSYLFGPGIVDHLKENQGFGQMGMGDYDFRLRAFCKMFIEKVGEEQLLDLLQKEKLDKEKLCKKECESNASGMSEPRSDQEIKKNKQTKDEQGNGEPKKDELRRLEEEITTTTTSPKDKENEVMVAEDTCTIKPKEPEPDIRAYTQVITLLDKLNREQMRNLIKDVTDKLFKL